MDLELRTLRYFVAVAEELHFGRAARRLESDLGVALFERSPSGVAPTEAGAWFQQDAQALLEQADRLRAKAAASAGAATLTVGMLSDAADPAAAHLVKAFRERHPRVDVQIREADFTDPTSGLRAGLVDVALTFVPLADVPPSALVVAWDGTRDDPLVRSFGGSPRGPTVPGQGADLRRVVVLTSGSPMGSGGTDEFGARASSNQMTNLTP